MDFETWIINVIQLDDRYSHLYDKSYEEERADFYVYYLAKMSPWQALQEEYREYD